MKKLLYFLFICSLCMGFVSCGGDDEPEPEPEKFVWNGDWNDPNDPNYKPEGYNPIEGLWRGDNNDKYGLYFSKDFKRYGVTFFENDQYIIDKSGMGSSYTINDKAYRYFDTSAYRYEVKDDKLHLVHQALGGILVTEGWGTYIRVKE